jgi:ribonuclease T1
VDNGVRSTRPFRFCHGPLSCSIRVSVGTPQIIGPPWTGKLEPMTSRLRVIAVAFVLCCAVAAAALYAMGRHPSAARPSAKAVPSAAASGVCRSGLPAQAQDTITLIAKGGPFPYRGDGTVFDNREHRLPAEPGGYYHEYTVATPGAADRGARRIVTGGTGEEYWTQDHYVRFQRIDLTC